MSNEKDNRTVILGEKALGYIKYNQSEAKPEDYELWFNYASGLKPTLNAQIKDLLKQTPRIPQEKITELYHTHFITNDMDGRVEEISSKVSIELNDIMDIVTNSLKNTEHYSESLDIFTSELKDINDTGSLKMMINSMAAATFEMAQNTKELEKNLKQSQKHITELNENIETIRVESMTDALTGIANRKKFDQTLSQEISLARKEDQPLCLLLTDIDHFKSFNDTHGHQTGDQVLRLVGSILKNNVKGRDLAARYGGEEFAIILSQTNLNDAKILAEQIRKAVANKELIKKSTGTKLGRVTLSIGIAALRPVDNQNSLIARADKCLYAAKDAGRNNVQSEDVLIQTPDTSTRVNANPHSESAA